MVVLWLSTFWKQPRIGRGYVSGDSVAEKPLVFCHSDVSKGIQPNRCFWVKGAPSLPSAADRRSSSFINSRLVGQGYQGAAFLGRVNRVIRPSAWADGREEGGGAEASREAG